MGKHSLQVSDIHDSAIAESLDPVLGKVLQEQSWWMERRGIGQFGLGDLESSRTSLEILYLHQVSTCKHYGESVFDFS